MLKWVYERVTVSLGDEQRFFALKKLMDTVSRDLEPSINLGTLCNRSLKPVHDLLLASSGSYAELKRKSNEAAAGLLEEARTFIEHSASPRERFVKACGLAAVSNVAPIGVPSAPFEFSMVEDIINGRMPLPTPIGEVYETAAGARNVFYVADNAGEIGFDSLVISILKETGAEVTLVVKEGPFFDDATPDDVRYFGLEQRVDALCTVKGGIFVPDETDPELALRFKRSDLVISKGTGNFEALMGYPGKKPILFLLKSKCRPVAIETGTPEGDFIVRLEA
jgi:uncharacterized protein with ATP-grasp and redox domains